MTRAERLKRCEGCKHLNGDVCKEAVKQSKPYICNINIDHCPIERGETDGKQDN